MKHVKNEFDKLTFKEVFTYGIAAFCMTAAVVAIFIGMYLPPEGEIHASILTYFGISSAFVGSLIGISVHYSNELSHFKTEIKKQIKSESDDNNKERE